MSASPDDGGTPAAVPPERDGRRWRILFVGLIAMTAGCTFQYGIAYLIPALRQEGFSLELASVLVACPTIGLLLTLIAWGAAADRWGERVVLSAGLGLAGLILLVAREVPGVTGLAVCLALAGAAGGSVFAASGRLILGWFARSERGLAMGIRQGAQPLGVAVAAVTLPTLGAGGRSAPLLFLAVFCLAAAAAVILVVRDPPRPAAAGPGQPRAASPYRQPVLWRIHAASALLVVSQFTVATFALVFLVDAGTGTPPPRAACWPSPRPAAPAPGSAPATGPTRPAAGCARCASWPSPPGSRCWPWPAPRWRVRPSPW
jgi:nitrate/nitrite transporter NarK